MAKSGGRKSRPQGCSLRSHRLRRLKPLIPTFSPAFHSAMPSMLTCCTSDLKRRFFKSVLSRDVAFGMERTRHQLAPAMPGQKIVDRAVAGLVPDGLFVGRLEIVDVQQFTCPGSLGKTRQQDLFISH